MRTFNTQDQEQIVQVTRASTLEELEEIRQFRYEVYATEMKLPLASVDHERQRISEDLDETAIHLIARVGDIFVGSVRINENRVARGFENALQVNTLPRPYCYCARLYVRKGWRGTGIMEALSKASFAEFDRLNSAVAICHCYPHLQKLYERMGFRPYGRPFVQPGLDQLGWQRPLICVLRPEVFQQLA